MFFLFYLLFLYNEILLRPRQKIQQQQVVRRSNFPPPAMERKRRRLAKYKGGGARERESQSRNELQFQRVQNASHQRPTRGRERPGPDAGEVQGGAEHEDLHPRLNSKWGAQRAFFPPFSFEFFCRPSSQATTPSCRRCLAPSRRQ